MARKSTKEEFILKARKLHGDKYDYSNVVYVNNKTEVMIKCPNHDEFPQKPNSHLSGRGCPACSNNVVSHSNSIASQRPDLIKYFIDKLDAHKYSIKSGKKLNFICPECGHPKELAISVLTMRGFSCNKCSDKISMPEKFMHNFLTTMNIDFSPQKIFSWAKNKRYDFYIPSMNMIIETHGAQHYSKEFTNGKTLKEHKENDVEKKRLAKDNGIKTYLEINCEQSDLYWLKDNFEKSLNKHFDLDNVDWLQIYRDSCKSRIIECCKLWMELGNKAKTSIVSNKMKLHQSTVIRYLKIGSEMGWCDYKTKGVRIRIGIFDNKDNLISVHKSMTEASDNTGITMYLIDKYCEEGKYFKRITEKQFEEFMKIKFDTEDELCYDEVN